jgi:hypothetical protein
MGRAGVGVNLLRTCDLPSTLDLQTAHLDWSGIRFDLSFICLVEILLILLKIRQ